MIENWIRTFLHPSYLKDERRFLHAKTMWLAFMLTSLFSFSYLLISYLIDFSYGIVLMYINCFCFLLLSLLLKTRLSLYLVGNLYVFCGSLAVVCLIYFSGGMSSPILPYLAASPTLALMVVGKRYATIWAFIMGGFVVLFGYLAAINFPLPFNYNPEWEVFFKVHCIAGLIFLVYLVNLAFHNSREKAYRVLAERNNELSQALTALEGARQALEKSHDDIVVVNHELLRQKELTENKNRAITSSLRYAKNMQNAIMPNPHILQSFFADSFFLVKPLKIVSGDFFWTTKVNGLIFLAVVDCTGHGVPGALMSVIGNNLLKEAVKLLKIKDPAEILKFLHKGIGAALNQEETANHDGMEVGLCVIDEENGKAYYSGAKISLVYFQDGALQYLKGDNQSIGGVFNTERKEFQVHTILLDKPTKFYMFTDGLKDQFGGPGGKKFLLRRILQTLEHVYQLPMPMQKSYIAEILNEWMKDEEQLDDITIVGFQPAVSDPSLSSTGSGFGLIRYN
jgi:serine phosphatase RsbU (regulator of sigma subunit)